MDGLCAPARRCLGFGSGEELRPEAAAPQARLHPEALQFAAVAPGPPADAGTILPPSRTKIARLTSSPSPIAADASRRICVSRTSMSSGSGWSSTWNSTAAARQTLLTADANAVAEELYFRGALWSVVQESHPSSRPRSPTPPRPPRPATPRSCSQAPLPACSSASSAARPAALWLRRSSTSHGRSSCCAISRPCSGRLRLQNHPITPAPRHPDSWCCTVCQR